MTTVSAEAVSFVTSARVHTAENLSYLAALNLREAADDLAGQGRAGGVVGELNAIAAELDQLTGRIRALASRAAQADSTGIKAAEVASAESAEASG